MNADSPPNARVKNGKLSGLSWTKISVECLTIVASILLAFSIDAWWANRLDRSEERELLVGLENEFRNQRSDLRRFQQMAEEMLVGMEVLMVHIARPDTHFTLEQLDRGLLATLNRATWDPSSSVLNAVVSSGRLELVRSDSLRLRLAGWSGEIDEVLDNQLLMLDFLTESLWPSLAASGAPMARGWDLASATPLNLIPEAAARESYDGLRDDLPLLNLISTKHATWGHSMGEFAYAIEQIDLTLQLIATELAH